MSDQMSLEGILSNEAPPAREPAPAVPAVETVADTPAPAAAPVERPISRKVAMRDKEQLAQGRVRDPETGQYAKVEETPAVAAPAAKVEEPAKPAAPAAAPQQEFTEKEKAFLRAAQEERGKRQALEARIAAMEAAKPQEPAKTFWDDPEAALKAHEDRIKAESTNARLGMAEFTARQRHPDFDEKVAAFAQVIQQTPGLHQQWLAAPDPAEYAYTVGKNHLEFQQVGSLEEMRAKIERETTARVRTQVEGELKAKADALAKDRAALPGSLSDARSTGGAARAVWGGAPSLEDILKG